ncbi:MAG: thioredoxin domain-containing protein [Myxococcaceae bacterium]
MRTSLRASLVAAASFLLLAGGCAKDSKTVGKAAVCPGDLAPDTVVATYGDKKITAAEIDGELGDQFQEIEKQKYQMRVQAIDKLVIQALVKAEAAKKGLTEEQFLKAEIDDKVPPPSDAEIQAMFEQNASQLPPGSKLEDFKDRIVDFMTRPKKQERAKALFDELRKGANVQVKLEEPAKPRKQVEAKGPSRGPENAKVTIVEFSDFQCPYCSKAHDTVEEVMQAYAGKVRLVFRHFPLEFHKLAPKAAEASLCAHDQGHFWDYHDALFKNQQKLEIADLKAQAAALGLDAAKFDACLDGGAKAAALQEDMAAAKKVGVTGTPAFFINGVSLSGAQPIEEFKKIIDAELAAK